jgi:urea transport system ATP-binding protein
VVQGIDARMLKIEKLTKSFGKFVAVRLLDLSVEKGELRCIIGPNGAGKTTLFNLISGYLKPDRGLIKFNNEDITNLNPHEIAKRGMIRKFQVPNIFPMFSVRHNLTIPCQVQLHGNITLFTKSSPRVATRIDEILELTRLREKEDEIADELSHGEKQWLEIGMALAMEPRLMLLDEPTAGMTIEETDRTADIIQTMSDTTTILVIEHDIQFIRKIARRITVMHYGEILAEGPLEQIEGDERVRNVYLGK